MQRITTRAQLSRLAGELEVADWHEPDQVEVTAKVFGTSFDNAGTWPMDGERLTFAAPHLEMYVELSQDGKPVACVNLATLLAWASNNTD